MDISVVIPLFNEEESLPELYAWIERVMKANDFSYEVIFINDGSTDRSWQVIEELRQLGRCHLHYHFVIIFHRVLHEVSICFNLPSKRQPLMSLV